MSSNVSQVEAETTVDPDCGVIDQKPSGECDVISIMMVIAVLMIEL